MQVSLKSLFAGAIAVGISAGLATSAGAQAPTVNVPSDKPVKPFSVKLGVTFPSDGDIKDNLGSTWFGFGLSYDIGKTKTESPVVYGAYFDGTFASKSGNEASALGLGAQARYYFGPTIKPVNFYAGGGLGAYFLKSKKEDPNGFSETATRFGGKLMAGAEWQQGFLAELAYTFPGNVHGSNLNHFALYAGYRF